MPETTKPNGPRIELRVVCGDCRHIDADGRYDENGDSELGWFCGAQREKDPGTKGWLPGGPSYGTPSWCPFYPTLKNFIAEVPKS